MKDDQSTFLLNFYSKTAKKINNNSFIYENLVYTEEDERIIVRNFLIETISGANKSKCDFNTFINSNLFNNNLISLIDKYIN